MDSGELVTFHRREDRFGRLRIAAEAPIVYSAAVGSWVVTAPRDIAALLKRRDLRESPTDGIEKHLELEKTLGRSFPNIIFLFRYLPLSLEGPKHRTVRRRMADLLGSKRDEISAVAPELVEKYFAALNRVGEVDVMKQVIEPLIVDIMVILTGVDVSGHPEFSRVNSIFDRLIGARKRLQQEEAAGTLRALIREKIGPDASDEDEGVIASYLILGRDSLGGSLGESLYRLFAANQGVRLDAIAYPPTPNETGVPYVERIADRDFEHDGTSFRAGDRIRLQMQSFAYAETVTDKQRIFGVGVHACLGKRLSLEVWGLIVAALRTKRTTLEVIDYAARDWDFVFTYPQTIRVAVR